MKLRLLALTAVLLAFTYATPRSLAQDQGAAKPGDTASESSAPKSTPAPPGVSSLRTLKRSGTTAAKLTLKL